MPVLQLPAWAPFATHKVISGWPTGGFYDTKHIKVVWHTTQGTGLSGLFNWYRSAGGIPHFTLDRDGRLYQHYPTDRHSRALLNRAGGVQTNLDGAIQIEIVGYAGTEFTRGQLAMITKLTKWFTEGGITPVTPMGRLSKPYTKASFTQWDNGVGHWAHGQVPENTHTDPDFTDSAWAALRAGFNLRPSFLTGPNQEDDMLIDTPFAEWYKALPHSSPTKYNSIVELWQTALATLGFYDGEIDGKAGPITKAANTEWEHVLWPNGANEWPGKIAWPKLMDQAFRNGGIDTITAQRTTIQNLRKKVNTAEAILQVVRDTVAVKL